MIRRSSKDLDALFEDEAMLARAFTGAFADAVRRHRQGNVPMVFWEDGKVVLKSPFEVPIPEDEEEAAPG